MSSPVPTPLLLASLAALALVLGGAARSDP